MALKEKLMDDYKSAMKEKNAVKKSTVTLIRSAIKQQEIDTKQELNDEDILDIISKHVKQKKESIIEFEKGQRHDLIEQAEQEIAILMEYLPEQLSEQDVRDIITSVIEETGASTPKDMGKVMPKVMERTKGRADGKMISTLVKEALNS